MGAYKYIKESFESEYKERSDTYKARMVLWKDEPSVKRIDKPTNIARARELGYKAKPGIIVVRARIKRGKRKREKQKGGRKPSKSGRFFAYRKSLQSMAEERASRKYMNCEVVNSYYVGADGKEKFFEVILADRTHGSAHDNSVRSGVIGGRGRAFRGLTSSGRKHRGITKKTMSSRAGRPSVRSAYRQIKV